MILTLALVATAIIISLALLVAVVIAVLFYAGGKMSQAHGTDFDERTFNH